MKPLACSNCGQLHQSDQVWIAVHFGLRDIATIPSVLLLASTEEFTRLGEHAACSLECAIQLIRSWATTWIPDEKKVQKKSAGY